MTPLKTSRDCCADRYADFRISFFHVFEFTKKAHKKKRNCNDEIIEENLC